MDRLSPQKQKIWKELNSLVDKQPPRDIKDRFYQIFLMPSRLWESTWLLDKMDKLGKVLDVGCGNCAHMLWLASHGFEYVGIDPKFSQNNHLEVYLNYLKSFVKPEILKNITILPYRMEEITWENEFDYVISVSVVEHVPHEIIRKGMGNLMRALKPGCKMYHIIDQKITKDAGDTYIDESMFKDGTENFRTISQYYEDVILGAGQCPEISNKGKGLYFNVQSYVEKNPDRWSKGFPEFLHAPYALEFKKRFMDEYTLENITKAYVTDIFYDKLRPQIVPDGIKRTIEYMTIGDIENQVNLKIKDILKAEDDRWGKFWSQQKINEIYADLKGGHHLDPILLVRKDDRLLMHDGYHRLYVLQGLFGNEAVIPVGILDKPFEIKAEENV